MGLNDTGIMRPWFGNGQSSRRSGNNLDHLHMDSRYRLRFFPNLRSRMVAYSHFTLLAIILPVEIKFACSTTLALSRQAAAAALYSLIAMASMRRVMILCYELRILGDGV